MRRKERKSIVTCALIFLIFIATNLLFFYRPAQASPAGNETPSSDRAVFFGPIFWKTCPNWTCYDTELKAFRSAMKNESYKMTEYLTLSNTTNPVNATLTTFNQTIASGGYGVIYISTHGSSDGDLAVEVYNKTDEGKKARHKAFDNYCKQGYVNNTEIWEGENEDGVDICVTQQFIINRAKFADSIVYVAACDSAADSFGRNWTKGGAKGGARVMLGYKGDTTYPDLDAETFWRNMDGTASDGLARPVFKAVADCKCGLMVGDGAQNTVLAPKVMTRGSSSVVFDCKMDTSIDARKVITGPIKKDSQKWVGDDTVTFEMEPGAPWPRWFVVHANKSLSCNNGVELDGNQKPNNRTSGVGPNGDDYVYKVEEHDNAMQNVGTLKNYVGQGYSLHIIVTTANQGGCTETFNVTAYANTTSIATQTVTLASGNSTILTFAWNTAGFAEGYYNISAYAWPVINETDIDNNNLTDGQVKVVVPGDVNGDGIVNMQDIYTGLILHFMCMRGDPGYVANSDIYDDGIINMQDIYIAILHFMQTDP